MVETVTGGNKLPSRWADAAKDDGRKPGPSGELTTPRKENAGTRHSPRRTPHKGPHIDGRQSNDGPNLKDRLTLPINSTLPSETSPKSPRKRNSRRRRRSSSNAPITPSKTEAHRPAAAAAEWDFDENEDYDWADEA